MSSPNLQTSQEWYKQEKHQNIIDADGWRDLQNGQQGLYWHTEKISSSEFQNRRRKCTLTLDPTQMPTYPYFQTLEEWKKTNSVS